VDAPSLQAFKARLDVALGSLGCWLATLHIAGGWNSMSIVSLFNPGHPMVLWEPMRGSGLFPAEPSNRARGNGHKLQHGGSKLCRPE